MPARLVSLVLLGLLALAPAARSQQTDEAQVDRFLQFLRAPDYAELLGRKALETDRQMPPTCEERELVGRTLFAVTERPRFIESREVPIAGSWAERVTVRRCGRVVEHNIYLFASRVRGLHAVAGFPGRTLTQPQLQFEVARALLARGRRLSPGCETFDVVETQLIDRPAGPTAPWTERWHLYMCGETRPQRVRFSTDSEGRTNFTLQD